MADLKAKAKEIVALRGMEAGMNCRAGDVAELTKSVADLIAAMQPTDANYLDLQDAHKSYSSCEGYSSLNTRVHIGAGKVLQLCQLRDGDGVTPLPAAISLQKSVSAGPGKLAKDASEAQQALATKRSTQTAVANEDSSDPPPDANTEGE